MALIDAQSLEDFFNGLLSDALDATGVELCDGSRAYLLQLVGDCSRVEELHRGARPDDPGTPTLVSLYERAQFGAPSERFDAWRQLGDVALIVAGLFGAYLQRRQSLVGLDYYVRMGAGAYGSAATYHRSGFGPIFEELAAQFRNLVDVLTRVGEATTLPVAHGLERLYDRWAANPSQIDLHERLIRNGAIPILGRGGMA
ncbi:MAG: hypothetical protein AAFU79_10575 [Myxococcota bacterium]